MSICAESISQSCQENVFSCVNLWPQIVKSVFLKKKKMSVCEENMSVGDENMTPVGEVDMSTSDSKYVHIWRQYDSREETETPK